MQCDGRALWIAQMAHMLRWLLRLDGMQLF